MDPSELLFSFDDGRAHPAHDHRTAAPALHVLRVRRDAAIEVLDRIRTAELRVQHAVDAEALEREGVVESLAHGRRRTGMVGGERGRQALESTLRELRISCVPRVLQHRRHVRVHAVRQVPQNVPALVDLTPLDRGQRAEHLADRGRQGLGSVDHEQPRPVWIHPAVEEVAQQRLGHVAVLGVTFPQAQNLLLALRIDAQGDHHRMVAQDDPIDHHDREVAIPERCGQPVRQLLRGHGDVAAGDGLGAQLAISVNNCPPPRDPRSRMTSFKRTQRKYVQKAYRVRNWREYETGLRARGSLTVWLGLTDGKLANWNSPRPTRRTPGRQRKYSNHAIETTVTLGLVFGLASRQTEGFLRSLLTLLNLDNDVPDHSTISRRKARLGKVASYERRTVKPVHLLIDSSGLSVHVGQLRTPPKARDYRKLHLAVDEQTSDVVACDLTSKRARDASRVASLVGQIERPIASAKADAAYDTGDVYKTLEHHRAHRSPKVLIPPRKGAQLALDSAGTRQRNRNIRARSRVGKRKWYVASGYSRRSKVETTFHRYKAILGSAMRARGLASQRVEVRLGCKILNTMTALGIPDGEMIG